MAGSAIVNSGTLDLKMRSSTSIDNEVFDTLARKTHASDLILYLILWRLSLGEGRATVTISFNKLAAYSGLSTTTVQAAIQSLRSAGLVGSRKAGPTTPREYQVKRPWKKKTALVVKDRKTTNKTP